MEENRSPDRPTPDPGDPSHCQRLAEILRLLRLHGFYVSEGDVWGDPRSPVIVQVEGCDEVLKDYALFLEAVASGQPDPHTLVSLYAFDLRDRRRWRHRKGRPGGG